MSNSDSDDYDSYMDSIYEDVFPKKKFSISLALALLDVVVTNRRQIIIRDTYNCCVDTPHDIEYYVVRAPAQSDTITHRTVIMSLIANNFVPNCVHNCYNGLTKVSDDTYDLYMCRSSGSAGSGSST